MARQGACLCWALISNAVVYEWSVQIQTLGRSVCFCKSCHATTTRPTQIIPSAQRIRRVTELERKAEPAAGQAGFRKMSWPWPAPAQSIGEQTPLRFYALSPPPRSLTQSPYPTVSFFVLDRSGALSILTLATYLGSAVQSPMVCSTTLFSTLFTALSLTATAGAYRSDAARHRRHRINQSSSDTHLSSKRTTVTLPAGWSYSGCYQDPNAPRLLSTRISSSSSNTQQSCVSQCSASGYTYAGVEFGQECW